MEKQLVIGGAGFIGVNLAKKLLEMGHEVVVLDNFSRKGTRQNFEWLKKQFGQLWLVEADIRFDKQKVSKAMEGAKNIFHLAAQVAVTTSVKNPREDFEINALGTLNILEAMRENKSNAFLLFASTNKVYGGLESEPVIEKNKRFEFKKLIAGVGEQMPLDFHSPYGCSKGAADQYVRDYSRIYGLDTVVFRQSCIYGQRQFGIEDQGWVAWFSIASLLNWPVTIYGSGKQVRDVLDVRDLVNAFLLAEKNAKKAKGKIYNIGGGPKNTLSLIELVEILEKKNGRKLERTFSAPRPGDQPIYVSDISMARKDFGWLPKISTGKGVDELIDWVQENLGEIKSVLTKTG